MFLRNRKFILAACLLALTACQKDTVPPTPGGPTALKDVPSVRLNYRYEPDVPPPEGDAGKAAEERNAAVQADFDQNRLQEQLFTTISSPDKKKVLVVYTRINDAPSEFRLDMYSPDGALVRKITPDSMAVHFPDTIVWAPDSSSVAFVAMVRSGQEEADAQVPPAGGLPATNSNTAGNANTAVTEATPETAPAVPTPTSPPNVLTFRTEQIYICNAEGDGLKPLTQNEGYIYFYYVWSPDSTALAAMALTAREWEFVQFMADKAGEAFVPVGRPRIVEKNGRERRLDDALTKVHPVWSPDSAKVACGFQDQVRIYDAMATAPTQAAIPLRNQLLISAQAYDMEQQRQGQADNTVTNQASTVLPDEKTLVSYNPIIDLKWISPDLLYFQTGYVKLLKKEADSVRSYLRWHRLIFSPQPMAPGAGK